MDIVEKIKILCNEKVMTIAELERNLGLRVPGVDKVQKVADYFSVSTDYLLGRVETPQWSTEQNVLDIERALHINNNVVAYDGIELTDDEKKQVDETIRSILWKRLKNKQ